MVPGTTDPATTPVGCSHISTINVDAAAKASILSKYQSVLTWNVQRSHAIKNPAKRRKVGRTLVPSPVVPAAADTFRVDTGS
jgi:hypothetical protein